MFSVVVKRVVYDTACMLNLYILERISDLHCGNPTFVVYLDRFSFLILYPGVYDIGKDVFSDINRKTEIVILFTRKLIGKKK